MDESAIKFFEAMQRDIDPLREYDPVVKAIADHLRRERDTYLALGSVTHRVMCGCTAPGEPSCTLGPKDAFA